MSNTQKTMRAKQHLILAHETVRSLLSPAFSGNEPQKPTQEPQPQDKQTQHKLPTDDPLTSCAPVCGR